MTAPPCVVDASVLAALLYGEPRRDEAAAVLEGTVLFAPPLLPLEVANAGVKKVRAGSLTTSAVGRALVALAALDVTFAPIDIAAVAVLAVESRLTAYDASYLWLARHLGARLETFDDRLRTAFETLAGAEDDGETNS